MVVNQRFVMACRSHHQGVSDPTVDHQIGYKKRLSNIEE